MCRSQPANPSCNIGRSYSRLFSTDSCKVPRNSCSTSYLPIPQNPHHNQALLHMVQGSMSEHCNHELHADTAPRQCHHGQTTSRGRKCVSDPIAMEPIRSIAPGPRLLQDKLTQSSRTMTCSKNKKRLPMYLSKPILTFCATKQSLQRSAMPNKPSNSLGPNRGRTKHPQCPCVLRAAPWP